MYNIISNPEMNQRVNLIKSNALLKNLTLNKIGSFIQMSTLASFLAN